MVLIIVKKFYMLYISGFHSITFVYSRFFPKIQFLYCLLTGPILDIMGMGAFYKDKFSEKKAFCLLAPPKQLSFLTTLNENIFFKSKGTRLGVIVAHNKGLE